MCLGQTFYFTGDLNYYIGIPLDIQLVLYIFNMIWTFEKYIFCLVNVLTNCLQQCQHVFSVKIKNLTSPLSPDSTPLSCTRK